MIGIGRLAGLRAARADRGDAGRTRPESLSTSASRFGESPCSAMVRGDMIPRMRTLDKDFRSLTRAAFARYGFAYADLITQWPAIVGDDVAQWSEPERIRWPRAGADERKQGGTLVILVTPGRGLDLQHETPRIIDRINAFYGYSAIAQVRIVQGALNRQKAPSRALPAARRRRGEGARNQASGSCRPRTQGGPQAARAKGC